MSTILVIEDVPAVLFSVRVALESVGHKITTAKNGNLGLDLMKFTAFDLVITDIWMPGTGGADVIRLGRECSPTARFLAITGGNPNASGATVVSQHERFGADAVLLKPFDLDDLERAVSGLLGGGP